jgi:NTE family protein
MAIVWAGGSRPSREFLDLVRSVFGASARTMVLTHDVVRDRHPGAALDDPKVSAWLNALEGDFDFVFYIADETLTDWTKKCVRQADAVLLVGCAGAGTALNDSERFALSVLPRPARRLILLHQARSRIATGTSAWLAPRDAFMHHHVALQDPADMQRLCRFLSGRAVGFVAAGGGALGCAHLGAYQALSEAGAAFDILGGTSVGAAMMAAFAYGLDAERVDQGTRNIFVTSRAFRRLTLPRFGLLDHKVFDRALRAEYGDVLIEDLWRPFFALSSNLCTQQPMIHRSGPVWQAVRASASIPGVLPPFFTRAGDMLVDGALMDNVPLVAMKELKTGPNVIVLLKVDGPGTYQVDYESIPGARELLIALLNPFVRRPLPQAPGILQVIMLSMLANSRRDLALEPTDLVIRPELPADIRFNSWERHTEIFRHSHRVIAAWLQARLAEAHPGVLAVIRAADGGAS